MKSTQRNKSSLTLIMYKILSEHKKGFSIIASGYLVFLFLIGIWEGYLGGMPTGTSGGFYILFSGFPLALGASLLFSDMSRKEGRISLLMIPATAFEKFLPRFILAFPVVLTIVILGFFTLSYGQILGFGYHTGLWTSPVNPFGPLNQPINIASTFFLLSIFLFNEALYMFGSIAWPKYSFIKTFGIMVAGMILISIASTLIEYYGIFRGCEIFKPEIIFYILGSIGITGAILLFYFTYQRFRKATV